MEKKQSGKVIIILLAALLLGVLGYTFYSNAENKKMTTLLEVEKTEIKSNLDEMIAQYDTELAQGNLLKEELTAARENIVSYRDSLKKVKSVNYRAIRRYRKRVSSLQAKNKKLFTELEALRLENEKLNAEILVAVETIERQSDENDVLTDENKVLVDKVAIGGILSYRDFTAIAMKELSTGSLKETNKYKNTDVFTVYFKINKNELTVSGDKLVYIVIKDPKGAVVSPEKGVINVNGSEINYSESKTINYQNTSTDVTITVEVNKKELIKGVYTISASLDGEAVGSASVKLRGSFLGIF